MKYSSKFSVFAVKSSPIDAIKKVHSSTTSTSAYRLTTLHNTKGFTLVCNRKGFTLIEIVVVIILISIAGSLVLMNIGQSGRMKESRIFADKMVSICKKARIKAMTKGVPSCLTISPELRECRIGFIDETMLYENSSNQKSGSSNGESGLFNNNESGSSNGESGLSNNSESGLSNGASGSSNSDTLKIPENILIEGENIKIDYDGVYYICFYPDGSSGGGILTLSVENEFEFTFQVDILTGSIKEIADNVAK